MLTPTAYIPVYFLLTHMFIPIPHRLYPCLFPPHLYVHPNSPQTISLSISSSLICSSQSPTDYIPVYFLLTYMFILIPHRLYPCLFPPHLYVHPNPPTDYIPVYFLLTYMFILIPHRLYPCLFPPHLYVHPNPPQTISLSISSSLICSS